MDRKMQGLRIRQLRILLCVLFASVFLSCFYWYSSYDRKYTIPRPIFAKFAIFLTALKSRTTPPFYPVNGTGQTVNISGDFDLSTFSDFCEVGYDLVAVVPVHSAPGNIERRQAIRETVGKTCSKLRCKVFFIVGVSLDKTTYDNVKHEYYSMRDILIVDKVDTYRDLNNKVVAMLDWLIRHCRKAKYVIHIIDDFYPNLQVIIDQLQSIEEKKYILGYVQSSSRPIRARFSKWFVSQEEFPYDKFPVYPSGVVYAFPNDQSAALRQSVHYVEYCWIEDVWVGFVRQGAGLNAVNLRQRYLDNNILNQPGWSANWNMYSGFHNMKAQDFYLIYNETK